MGEPNNGISEEERAKMQDLFDRLNLGETHQVEQEDKSNNNSVVEEIFGLDENGKIIVAGTVIHEAVPFCAPEDVKEEGVNDEVYVNKWRHRAQLIFADVCELNLIYKMKMGERLLREVGPLVETLDVGKVKFLDEFDPVVDMDDMKFYHLPGSDMRDLFFNTLGQSPSDELLGAICDVESRCAYLTDRLQIKFEFEKGQTDPGSIPTWFFFPWLKRAFKTNVKCEISMDASLAENLAEILNDILWFFLHHFLELSLLKLRMMVPEDGSNAGNGLKNGNKSDDVEDGCKKDENKGDAGEDDEHKD